MTELPAEPRTGSEGTGSAAPAAGTQQFQYVEEFVRYELGKSLGGARGMFESALPFVAFTIAWVIGRELYPAIGAALGTAVLLAMIRILQRQSIKYVAQAVMLGDKRKFPIMLIVPNYETLARWAREQGLASTEPAALIAERRVQQLYEREMSAALAGLARYETPKKLVLVEQDFSIDGGELTPKMSIRRNVVEEKNKAAIDALYAGPAPTDGV